MVTRETSLQTRTDASTDSPSAGGSVDGGGRYPRLRAVVGWSDAVISAAERWSSTVGDGAFLGLMAVLALALRIPRMGIAYWGDETISVGIASRPLHQIPFYLRFDGSPPIYYVVLHFWIKVFGSSPVATHSLSLLVSLVAIPVAWWCAGRLFGPSGRRPAALVAAVCPYLAYYGTETRMYSIVVVATMPAVTGFVRALRTPEDDQGGRWWQKVRHDPANRWIALGAVATLVVLYTHNWGLFLTAALGLTGLGWAARRARTKGSPGGSATLRRTLTFGAAVAVGYAPWLPSFLWQLRYTGAPWAPRPGLLSLVLNPLDATFSATIVSVETTRWVVGPGGRVDPAYLVVWVAVVAGVVYALVRRYRRHPSPADHAAGPGPAVGSAGGRPGSPPHLALVGAVVVVTLVVAWSASLVVHAWASRYLGVVIAPLLLVIAGTATSYRWARRLLPPLVLAMGLAALPVLADPPAAASTKSNAAAVDSQMRPYLAPGDLVISTAPSELPVISYYLPADLRYASVLGPVSDPAVVNWIDLTSRLAAADPRTNLARLIHTLPTGARVLLVNPVNWATTETPQRYAGVVTAAGIAVNQMVLNDPELTVVHSVIPRHPRASANPVEGILLVKGS